VDRRGSRLAADPHCAQSGGSRLAVPGDRTMPGARPWFLRRTRCAAAIPKRPS
jgi:hypothetical protein